MPKASRLSLDRALTQSSFVGPGILMLLLVGLSTCGCGNKAERPVSSDTQRALNMDAKRAAWVEPGAGEEKEIEIASGVRMKFCWIPAGEAQLGSTKAEWDAFMKGLRDDGLDEKIWAQLHGGERDAVRGVYKTRGFWLGKYSVTQEEWVGVMGSNPSKFNGKGMGRFPVESVTWNDCQIFLEKINRSINIEQAFGIAGRFTLPHEDQWEYACRGGKGNAQAFYFGDQLNGLQANCKGTEPFGTDTKGPWLERTTEVGSYSKQWPHPWGLCDMHGNVKQWCNNNKSKGVRVSVIRGGSWDSRAKYCRSAYRDSMGGKDADTGFRVCFTFGEKQIAGDGQTSGGSEDTENLAGERLVKAGEEREFAITDGVKMTFCWIPSGKARLGSPKEERDVIPKQLKLIVSSHLEEEKEDVRGVFKTKGYWFGKFPVTQGEWVAVMKNNPSWFKPGGLGKDKLQKGEINDTSRFPVETVGWNDCQRFLESLNQRTGIEKVFGKQGSFALPDEDEWEYACRGGKGNKLPFFWGNELNGTQANCDGDEPFGSTAPGQYLKRTCSVDFTNNGRYEKHPWGLCHILGNVSQWCSNSDDYFGDRIIVRGGCYSSPAFLCRSAWRDSAGSTFRNPSIGFRVCLHME